ncbi:MAG: hypothetical protein ABSG79_03665 [Bryobacteraceae bacterium]|jgi:hypothetical protein
MAEYFPERADAEQFMIEWFAKDGKPPVHFAKIFNNGSEKWIVNYDSRQSPRASPFIKVLEDHSSEIARIVRTPWPERQRQLEQQRINEEQRKRVAAIRQQRAEQRLCVQCGGNLGLIDRVLRRPSHAGCKHFRE